MNDDEFGRFCNEHPDLSFEITADGELIVTPQTFTLTGARNNKIAYQLEGWSERDNRGLTFDSSTGWVLPDSSRRSPDAAWILKARIRQIDAQSRERFWHICPDFVIELRSSTDRLRILREKMLMWLSNGVQLGWLIDPERHAVEIYRPGTAPQILEPVDSVTGGDPVAGFTLDLRRVWDPMA